MRKMAAGDTLPLFLHQYRRENALLGPSQCVPPPLELQELQSHDPQIRKLPSALPIQVRAAGDSDAAASEGRLPGHSDDLLIVNESGHLCAFCYHSEFVDLTYSLVDRFAFSPSDRDEPATAHEVADFKGAISVDT